MAPSLLRDASDLIRDFVLSQMHETGGFLDREGKPDLYYTVFGLDCLIALREELPVDRVLPYLESFGDGEGLDFVHLACLAHSYASAGATLDEDFRRRIAARAESHRSLDGGYHNEPGKEFGSAYGCFLAVGTYQNLGLDLPRPEGIIGCLQGLETEDGAYSNERSIKIGGTPPTAAAVTLVRHLEVPAPDGVAEWLAARFHESGGFLAIPRAPMPDLLSTATALHALSSLDASIEPFRDLCLDFIDSLWTSHGSFYGHWAEDHLDVEYTWYGLLALGHLSL
jgi:prenyltransferase beta subunit